MEWVGARVLLAVPRKAPNGWQPKGILCSAALKRVSAEKRGTRSLTVSAKPP